MKIHVNRIPFEGLREEVSYDPKTLDVERADLQLDQPISLSSFITKTEHTVVVAAEIDCTLHLTCARCLTRYDAPLHAAPTLTYEVMPTDVIDITEDIRQELILASPMIPVCQTSCRGLCLICGQNLNVAACQHQRE